jgi:hypothetical protein
VTLTYQGINYGFLALALFFGVLTLILTISVLHNALAPRLAYPLNKIIFHAALITISAVGSMIFYNLA